MDRSGDRKSQAAAGTSNDNDRGKQKALDSAPVEHPPPTDTAPFLPEINFTPDKDKGTYHSRYTFCAPCARGEYCPLAAEGSAHYAYETPEEPLKTASRVPVAGEMGNEQGSLPRVGEDVIQRSEALHQVLAANPPPGEGPWWNNYSTSTATGAQDDKVRIDSKAFIPGFLAPGTFIDDHIVGGESSLTVAPLRIRPRNRSDDVDRISINPPPIPIKSKRRASIVSNNSGSPPRSLVGSLHIQPLSNDDTPSVYSTTDIPTLLAFRSIDDGLADLVEQGQQRNRARNQIEEILQSDPSRPRPKRFSPVSGTIDRIRERNRTISEQNMNGTNGNVNGLDGTNQERDHGFRETLRLCMGDCFRTLSEYCVVVKNGVRRLAIAVYNKLV